MPRTSRSVAQRLASQNKARKRRVQRVAPAPPADEQIRDQRVADDALPSPPPAPMSRGTLVVGPRRPAAGAPQKTPAAPRRRYAEYADEYRYVWADLRRIAVVAGGLLVLLIVLSFFIR